MKIERERIGKVNNENEVRNEDGSEIGKKNELVIEEVGVDEIEDIGIEEDNGREEKLNKWEMVRKLNIVNREMRKVDDEEILGELEMIGVGEEKEMEVVKLVLKKGKEIEVFLKEDVNWRNRNGRDKRRKDKWNKRKVKIRDNRRVRGEYWGNWKKDKEGGMKDYRN